MNLDQLAEELTDHVREDREKDGRAFPPMSHQVWRNRRWLIGRGRKARATILETNTLNLELETLNPREVEPETKNQKKQ